MRYSKYGAKKTLVDNIKFDSKMEAQYYVFLKHMESLKKIEILDLQPKVYMTDAKILYKPDFLILEKGEEIYIDVKGFATPVFNLKKRLWKAYGPGRLRIIKKVSNSFRTSEEVESKIKAPQERPNKTSCKEG